VVITAMLVLAAAALGVGIGHLTWHTHPSGAAPNSAPTAPDSPTLPGNGQSPFGSGAGPSTSNAQGGPADVGAIAAKVDPGVADIDTNLQYQGAEAAGTGIVLSSDGLLLTNNHVINGATRIEVTDIGNGKVYDAAVLGYDSTHDVALLKLNGASGLTTPTFAPNARVSADEPVVGIGNALGAGGKPSIAGGEVTGTDQSISASDSLDGTSEQLSGLIGVNAGIQAGDSGGPLVNSSGAVIGVDTAASDASGLSIPGEAASEAFAIPIAQALQIVAQIRSGHSTSEVHVGPTAFLGVLITTGSSTASGADVQKVVSGGAAAAAGIVDGDVITSLDGQSIQAYTQISRLLVGFHPGQRIRIGWVDQNGVAHSATVKLTAGPPA